MRRHRYYCFLPAPLRLQLHDAGQRGREPLAARHGQRRQPGNIRALVQRPDRVDQRPQDIAIWKDVTEQAKVELQ
jgi:hypothetical protein